MKNIFTQHPQSIGETYFEHMKFASCFGIQMILGGVACIIHAVLPFLFEQTASHFLLNVMRHYVERMPKSDPRVVDLAKQIESRASELEKNK